MSRISILDCTLRDGGYINQWEFGHSAIKDIISNLIMAGMDIVECGFMRDLPYSKDKSVFSCVSQIVPFITPKKAHTLYVAMIALGDISPEKILPYDGTSIDGIRLTFHKHEWNTAKEVAATLMDKGYKVFVQPVGTTSYSDAELLALIDDVNRLHPFAFYLVDTLGIMYRNDLLRFFYLIDHNLAQGIKVGFHSHNNLQLSFANAQELLRMNSVREIIIDSSVYGMGRGVGNLSSELLAEYINTNIEHRYAIMPLLTIAEKYLMSIYAEHRWGYDLPYFLSATVKCHPNYASYLLNKGTLTIESIAKMLALLPSDKRDLYDKELIQNIYMASQESQIDDGDARNVLKVLLADKDVLLLAPGMSLRTHISEIKDYINSKHPFVISTNFFPNDFLADMVFVSNRKRLSTLHEQLDSVKTVVATSNLQGDLSSNVLFVNYNDYLGEGMALDNAGAMLIRLLKELRVSSVVLAGFDGFGVDPSSNYCVDTYRNILDRKEAEEKNKIIGEQLAQALKGLDYRFITPTRYLHYD